MSEKDFLVDAVAQFVNGREWQAALTAFLDEHVVEFINSSADDVADEMLAKGGGYSMEQYATFQAFTEMAERVLEKVVNELGCEAQDLVMALGESMKQGMSGERRFLVNTLLAFDDFEAFRTRMLEYGKEKQAAQAHGVDMSEWETQVAVAQSLMEAQARGLLNDSEQSYLPWAEALLGVVKVAEAKPTLEAGAKEQAVEGSMDAESEEQTAMEQTLIKERLKLELFVAQRVADANAEMRLQLLHLNNTDNEEEDEDENKQDTKACEEDLTTRFAELETVRERLKVVKTECFAFKNVTQDTMDHLYLFFKEKIHHHKNLTSQEAEISEFITARLSRADSPLVPLLLEWILLESESLRLQRQIRRGLGEGVDSDDHPSEESQPSWTQAWDENSQAFYYVNSDTGESIWEAPACGFFDLYQAFQQPSTISTSLEVPVKQEVSETKTNDYVATDISQNGIDDGPSRSALSREEDKEICKEGVQQDQQQTEVVDVAIAMDCRVLESEMTPEEQMQAQIELARIVQEQDEQRRRLEFVLELERARHKEDFRNRKDRIRHAKFGHKKHAGKNREEVTDDHEEAPTCNSASGDNKQDVSSFPENLLSDAPPYDSDRADSKEDTRSVEVRPFHPMPGRPLLDLTHLLSADHAAMHFERNRRGVLNPQGFLNPISLRYLAEQLAKKNVEGSVGGSADAMRDAELVLEESEDK